MAAIEILNLYLHDQEIGSIARLPGDRHQLTFKQDYIENLSRNTLSLSLKDLHGRFISDIKPTQTRLPPLLSNLLPEGPMRSYLANQAGLKSEREFYLLWILGKDLPGAIKIVPAHEQKVPEHASTDEIAAAFTEENDDIFRFSLAGVQMKFSAIKTNSRGLTIRASGLGGSWIVKLPDPRYPYVPENEYAMMMLARQVGIEVPETRLYPIEKIKGLPSGFLQTGAHVFAIKRFDRNSDGSRTHIEDFAQIFNVFSDKKYGHASYRNIAEVIWAEIGEQGIIEFIRRLIFTILIGNGDMHLKNWSLIYLDAKRPSLAPAYDFVSTIPYITNDNLALSLVDTKRFDGVTIELLKRFADKSKLPEKLVIDTAVETIDRFAEHWGEGKIEIRKEFKQTLVAHLKTLPLWRSRK